MKVLHNEWVHRTRFDPLRPGLTRILPVEEVTGADVDAATAAEQAAEKAELAELVEVRGIEFRRARVASELRRQRLMLKLRAVMVLVFAGETTWVNPATVGFFLVWTIWTAVTARKVRRLRAELAELTAPPARLLR